MVLAASRPQAGNLLESAGAASIISLAPLSDRGRRDLIERLLPGRGLPLPLVERLSQESGGNPFYLIEVARGLVQSEQLVRRNGAWQLNRPVNQIDVPHSIEGLVMANLDALDPMARSALQHASVIGMRFSYNLLAAIAPREGLDAALADLEQRGLITSVAGSGNDRSFAFIQGVAREVTYGSILRKTRRELHDRIARLAEASPQTPQAENLESLAYHYAAGGNQEKMVIYNWLVGQSALARFELEQACRHLRLAWGALSDSPNAEATVRRDVAEALADASTFAGDFAQATACYQVVQGLLGDSPEEQAALHYKLGRLHFYRGDADAASQCYEQALSLVAPRSALAAQINAETRLLFNRV
jgi:predicted ATPase